MSDAFAPLRGRWLAPVGDGNRRDEVLGQLRAQKGAGGSALDLRGISLVGEDLRGLDLTGCDLRGADLSEADLTKATLSQTQLQQGTLFRCRLTEATLVGANLSGANLSEIQAENASFGQADLSRAEFFGAKLTGSTLSGARLVETDFRAAELTGARIREADLSDAHFIKACLRKADLGKSRVTGADFKQSDLRAARLRALTGFEKASWVGSDIRDIDFTGAYLLRRAIMDENYLFEFRTRGRSENAVYWVWWVTSDCGRSLGRWLGWNVLVALIFAALYLQVDVDYGDHETVLSPIYYSFVTLTTLGYGDVIPASAAAQVLATVQVILGYLGLGGLLSIFANKMARRAD